MVDLERFDPDAYVAAAAPLVGLRLDAARQKAVAEALALVLRIGAPALQASLPEAVEPAPVFAPRAVRA